MSDADSYLFSNGVALRRSDLLDLQVERYTSPGNPNLHEPVEEEWLLKLFAEDPPERPVFLDVGAGVGYYAILVKRRWPSARVIAIDALPRHAAALRHNWAANGLSYPELELIEEAIGAVDGIALFRDIGYGSALAPFVEGGETIETRVRSLPRLLGDVGPVHLMKMDIQGAEASVLQVGAPTLCTNVRHLVVGTHGASVHRAVSALLAKAGYAIRLDDPQPTMQPDGLLVATRIGR